MSTYYSLISPGPIVLSYSIGPDVVVVVVILGITGALSFNLISPLNTFFNNSSYFEVIPGIVLIISLATSVVCPGLVEPVVSGFLSFSVVCPDYLVPVVSFSAVPGFSFSPVPTAVFDGVLLLITIYITTAMTANIIIPIAIAF